MKNRILGSVLKWLLFPSFFQQIFVGSSLWELCRVPGDKTEKSVGPPLEFLTLELVHTGLHSVAVYVFLCWFWLHKQFCCRSELRQFLCLRSLLDFRRVVDCSFCSALLLWRWEGRLLNSFHAGRDQKSFFWSFLNRFICLFIVEHSCLFWIQIPYQIYDVFSCLWVVFPHCW